MKFIVALLLGLALAQDDAPKKDDAKADDKKDDAKDAAAEEPKGALEGEACDPTKAASGCADGLRCAKPMDMSDMGDMVWDKKRPMTPEERKEWNEKMKAKAEAAKKAAADAKAAAEKAAADGKDAGARSDKKAVAKKSGHQCVKKDLCEEWECGAMKLVPALTAAAFIIA